MRGIIFCLVAALLISSVSFLTVEDNNTISPAQEYDIDQPVEDFPIMRGSSDWERLGLDEFAADSWKSALQIPQAVQDRMTTRALLLTYLNSPAANDFAYLGVYSMESRRTYLVAKSLNKDNGMLSNLEKREDATQVLLDELHSWEKLPDKELQHLTRNMWGWDSSEPLSPVNIAMIVIQQEYTSRMTTDEIFDLIKLFISFKKCGENRKILQLIGSDFFYCVGIVKYYMFGGNHFLSYHDEDQVKDVLDNPIWYRVSMDYYTDFYRGYYSGT